MAVDWLKLLKEEAVRSRNADPSGFIPYDIRIPKPYAQKADFLALCKESRRAIVLRDILLDGIDQMLVVTDIERAKAALERMGNPGGKEGMSVVKALQEEAANAKSAVITLRIPPSYMYKLERLAKKEGLKTAQAARAILMGGIDEAVSQLQLVEEGEEA